MIFPRNLVRWAGVGAVVMAAIPVIQRLVVLPVYLGNDASDALLAKFNRLASMLLLPGKVLVYNFWPPVGHHFSTAQLLVAAVLNLAVYFLILVLLMSGAARMAGYRRRPVRPGDSIQEGAEEIADRPQSPDRRVFLATAATGAAGLTVFATGAYPVLIEPGWLDVRRVTVPIRNLPPSLSGITIAQLTDLHHDEWISLAHIRDAVRLANELRPDIMALTGDYVTINPALIKPAVAELARLNPRIGTVAVLGNHDWWADADETRKRLNEADISVVDNSCRYLTADRKISDKAGAGLCIGGVGDLWEDEVNPEEAYHGVSKTMPRILLSHNPDVAEDTRIASRAVRVDLMLSGHTHGGQVRLPGFGTPIVPSGYGSKYAKGLVDGPGCPVQISAGVGLAMLPVRLNVRPEIVMITLRSA